MFNPFRAKRPRVRIGQIKALPGTQYTSEQLYEIGPESYAGPWKLEPETVLEVISTPKKQKK